MKCSDCPNLSRCIEAIKARREEASLAVKQASPDPRISAHLDLARAWASEYLEGPSTFRYNITMMELDQVFKLIRGQEEAEADLISENRPVKDKVIRLIGPGGTPQEWRLPPRKGEGKGRGKERKEEEK